MTEHTPGPWIAEGRGPNMTVVFAGAKPGNRPSPCILMDGDQEANARLIAAAPDLLAACKALISAYDLAVVRSDFIGHAHEMAVAAIGKAEGR